MPDIEQRYTVVYDGRQAVDKAKKDLRDVHDSNERVVRDVDRGLEKNAQTTNRVTGRMKAMWASVAAVVGTAVITALTRLGGKLSEIASAQEETASKFNITFGNQAKVVDEFVGSFGRLAGLTIQEGREITATLGAVAQGFNASQEESARFAQQTLRTAADMASFNNTNMPDMLQAIRSGLAGEIEPLRRFGIELSAANVETKALEMTGKNLVDTLTQEEKVYARLALIQEQASIQMGDLERTQSSFANQKRRFLATMRQERDEMAAKLLPTYTNLITTLNSLFLTATDMGAAVKTANSEIQELGRAEDALRVVEELQDKTGLSADESDRLRGALDLLQDMFPGYIKDVNDAGEAMSVYAENVRLAVEAQRDAASIDIAQNFTGLVRGFQDANQAIEQGMERQAALQAEILSLSEDLGTRGDPTTEAEARARIGAESRLEAFNRAFAETGINIREARAEVGEFEREIRGLVDLLGKERVHEAFVAVGVNRHRAFQIIDDIMSSGAPSPEGGGEDPVVRSLAAREKALKDEQNTLIETGKVTERLIEVNRELFQIQKDKKELQEAGLRTWVAEQERLERLIELEQTLRQVRDDSLEKLNALGPAEITGQTPLDASQIRTLRVEFLPGKFLGGEDAVAYFERFLKVSDELKDTQAEIGRQLQNVARAGRSVLRVTDMFTDLSDGAKRAAEGIFDIVDNLGALRDLPAEAGFLDKLVPGIGLAAGGLSIVASLFDGDDGEDIREAIEENTRRIEKSIKELAERSRPTEGLTQSEFDLVKSGVIDTLGSLTGLDTGFPFTPDAFSFESLSEARSQINDFFEDIEDIDTGLSEEATEALREEILRAIGAGEAFLAGQTGATFEQFEQLRDQGIEQFGDIFDTFLSGSLGGFNTDSVAGVLAQAQFAQQFGGATEEQTFQMIAEGLNNLDDLGADVANQLSGLQGIDITTTEGRDALRSIIEGIANSVGTDGFSLGEGLTPERLDDILGALSGFTGGVEGSEYTRSLQRVRTITEIQADELAAWAESTFLVNRQQLDRLASIDENIRRMSGQTGFTFRDPNFTNTAFSVGPIHVTGSMTDADIRLVMERIEEELRRAERAA